MDISGALERTTDVEALYLLRPVILLCYLTVNASVFLNQHIYRRPSTLMQQRCNDKRQYWRRL